MFPAVMNTAIEETEDGPSCGGIQRSQCINMIIKNTGCSNYCNSNISVQ